MMAEYDFADVFILMLETELHYGISLCNVSIQWI